MPGAESGLTTTEKFCVALNVGEPLSETCSVKAFVEFACMTVGRKENAPLLVSSVALAAADSSAKVSVCGGWSVSVALTVKATVWPTLTVWLVIGASVGGVLGGMIEFSVRAMVVVWLSNPHMAVMVTFDVPEVTVLEAVNVSVFAPPVTGFAANVAVTPLGRLLALKVYHPFKPFIGVTVIALVPFVPPFTVKLVGLADRLKFGAGAFHETESM